jgi:hypothetical protein
LYLRALFEARGYDVEIHPPVADSANRPDFLVSGAEGSFYVEAITIGLSPEKDAEQKRLLTLLDVFMDVTHPTLTSKSASARLARVVRHALRWCAK